MSYEGYEVWLCENGHKATYDCYNHPVPETWTCEHCQAPVGYMMSIDTTNGCGGEENMLRVITPPIMDSCALCQHKSIVSPAVYALPKCLYCDKSPVNAYCDVCWDCLSKETDVLFEENDIS